MTKVARLIAEETSREIAEKLLLLKVDDDVIAKGTGLTIDEIKKIRRELAESLQEP